MLRYASNVFSITDHNTRSPILRSDNPLPPIISHSLPPELTFSLPLWRKIAWTVLFAVMVIVSTGGNLIVIWIVLANKRMRTVTNYFIINLSIADTMVSTLNVIFNFIYMINFDWPFGNLYCKISTTVATTSISASVFTMMAIAYDR